MTEIVQVAGYDRSKLHVAICDEVCGLAEKVRGHMEDATRDLGAAGEALLRAKELVPHGEFGAWCDAEFPTIGMRTLQEFMNVAKRAKNEDYSFLMLGKSSAKMLAAPKVPASARQQAVAAHHSGEKVTIAKAKEIIAAHTPPRQSAPLQPDRQQVIDSYGKTATEPVAPNDALKAAMERAKQQDAEKGARMASTPQSTAPIAPPPATVTQPAPTSSWLNWERPKLDGAVREFLTAYDNGDYDAMAEARAKFN